MIVWLASYPRSGNTFLRILLKEFFGVGSFSIYDDRADIAADSNLSELVGHEALPGDWNSIYHQFKDDEDPIFVKTHDDPIDSNKAIYLIRDPRAVAVSYATYLSEYGAIKYSLEDVILGAVPFGSWARHVRHWAPRDRKDTLLLKYEDLCADPISSVKAIGTFLDIQPNAGEVMSFDSLKAANPRFFRTGSNEKNVEALSQAQIELVNAVCAREIEAFGYSPGAMSSLAEVVDRYTVYTASGWLNRRKILHGGAALDRSLLAAERQCKDVKKRSREEVQRHKDRLKTVQADLDGLARKNEALAEKNRETDKILAAVERKAKAAEEQLLTQRKAQEREIRSLNETLAEAKQRYEALLEQAEAEKSQLENDLNAAIRRGEAFQQRWQDSSAEIELVRQSRDAALEQGAALASKNVQLEQCLTEEQRTIRALRERLIEYGQWTAPRLLTLLTLRPLRLALRHRAQVKTGELVADEYGILLKPDAAPKTDQSGQEPVELDPTTECRPDTEKSGAHNSIYPPRRPGAGLGIVVFAYDRPSSLRAVLESLKLQEAIGNTHVWIDGDQGRPDKRAQLDKTAAVAQEYGVHTLHRNAGNFGFRKMILTALKKMSEQYDRLLILEDDCFPTRHAVAGFEAELDLVEQEPDIFSVYGHPFLVDGEGDRFGRFQGWGWATTVQKLRPILDELTECYMLAEEDYLAFVDDALTDDIRRRIDVTPGRNPSTTLKRFFAWDEVLGLLTARAGLWHRPSKERLIYNFGMGEGSTHFKEFERFRKPPFNLIRPDEVWQVF
ncbi:MAG: sulfotransferase domain-containing protein [Ruegeria sp.]